MIRKGDKVIMNDRYYVSEKNKGKSCLIFFATTALNISSLLIYLE